MEFRRALREAMEGTRNLAVTNGVVNMSAADHLGLDSRARVMVCIEGAGGNCIASPALARAADS